MAGVSRLRSSVSIACTDGGLATAQVRKAQRRYMAEIPAYTPCTWKNRRSAFPRAGVSEEKSRRSAVLAGETVRVDSLRTLAWQRLRVRATERGELCERFAARRVCTVHDGQAVEDWLVMREEATDRYRYALSNASADTSLEQLAWWKCQRYVIERANQDAKSELRWDEWPAQKYRAWDHHLALTVLASWFISQTQLDWRRLILVTRRCSKNWKRMSYRLCRWPMFGVTARGYASETLTEEQATERVIEHLLNPPDHARVGLKNNDLKIESTPAPREANVTLSS